AVRRRQPEVHQQGSRELALRVPERSRMRPRIIAISANARFSGKGTMADVLVREYGYKKFLFSFGLKASFGALCMAYGIPGDMVPRIIDGDLKETPLPELAGLTYRTYCEGVGTDWGRNMIDYDLWVKMSRGTLQRWIEKGYYIVAEDIRFPNEANLAKE